MVVRLFKGHWCLLFIFLASLCIRLGVYAGYLSKDSNYWQVDSMTYHLVAQNIAEGKGITLSDKPHFYRVPGYPLFIAGLYKFCDAHPDRALWFQVVLASFIPVLVSLLSLTLFPALSWLACAAGLVSALHLGLVLYSGFFMTESLFILLFLLFALFFFRPGMRMRNLILSGLFLGCASLVRPVGHYVVVLALIVLVMRSMDPGSMPGMTRGAWNFSFLSFRTRIRNPSQCLTFLLAWLVPVSFWLIRNLMLTGTLFFHTLPGGHFLYLSAARVAMYADDTSYFKARRVLMREVHALVKKQSKELKRPLQEIETCCLHEAVARKYFLAHPLIALKVWATDMIRTCFSLYSAELLYLDSGRRGIDYFDKDRTWHSMFERYLFPQTDNVWLIGLIYAEMAMFAFILFGLCVGLWWLVCGWMVRKDRATWVSVMAFMGLFIVLALSGGYARMRLPIEPFLIILSLYGWGLLCVRNRKKGA